MAMGVITDETINFIKKYEGLRLRVYLDSRGLKTVGYGHRCPSLEVGDTITETQAEDFLRADLQVAVATVYKLVKVELTDNQFSALVSFVFNVGSGNFKNSRLLFLINRGLFDKAALQFGLWDKANEKVINGLVKRRQAEKELFCSNRPLRQESKEPMLAADPSATGQKKV